MNLTDQGITQYTQSTTSFEPKISCEKYTTKFKSKLKLTKRTKER